jgi:hypothetical protein
LQERIARWSLAIGLHEPWGMHPARVLIAAVEDSQIMQLEAIEHRESLTAGWPWSACVSIGEVSLALRGTTSGDIRLDRQLGAFQSESANPDIEVNVEWKERLRPWQGNPVFNSGSVWTLFHDGADFVFDFVSSALSPHPYKRMRVSSDFRVATITLNREVLRDRQPVFALEYPADELLVTNYLANGLGVEVHGCGLVDFETGGHLFLGHSGAGKSTTAKLWQSLRDPEILSDDRIILRLQEDGLWMHGTPWHGEAAFAAPAKARINRIFIIEHGILEHGGENKITPLTRSRAVGELFARSFPPFHSASGLERTVGFLEQILNRVHCYPFQFIPDAGAVEKVIGFHD